jgi:hypothetical protein
MTAVLNDIKKLIVDGIAFSPDLIFRDFVPPDPDAVVSLLGYGSLVRMSSAGGSTQEVFGTTPASIIVIPHRVQVLVRGGPNPGGYDGALNLAENIWEVVFGVEVDINGHHYHSIIPQQAPFFLDRDVQRRPSFAWNIEVLLRH